MGKIIFTFLSLFLFMFSSLWFFLGCVNCFPFVFNHIMIELLWNTLYSAFVCWIFVLELEFLMIADAGIILSLGLCA